MQNKNFALFPHLNSFLDGKELDVYNGVLELRKRHISIFGEGIRPYNFPDLKDFQKYFCFVHNPFVTNVGDLPSQDNLLEEEFIDTVQSCKSGRTFRVGFGPKVDKIAGLIRACDVLFVLGAQKYNQNKLATFLKFSDLT